MFTVPNILTSIRIILIPFIVKYFLTGQYFIAGILFAISALTDFFDGYIARKYNTITPLGKILDPAADKLTIISILIVLVLKDIIPSFIALILLAREIFIFISAGISFLLGHDDFIDPSKIGKISIFLLYLAIALKLLNIKYIGTALFYVVIPLNLYSGIDYCITTVKLLSNKQ